MNKKAKKEGIELIRRTLQNLVDYQEVFEYEGNEKEWNKLQENIRELYVLQQKLVDSI